MRVLFLTTRKDDKQGDYGELSNIIGFRQLLGDNFVEYPRKHILYGDYSRSPKNTLHGMGFTYCNNIILDTSYNRSNLRLSDFDVVIHGSGHMYGDLWEVDHPAQYYTCFHDMYGDAPRKILYNGEYIIGTQYTSKCFKRELVEAFPTVWPAGFGIPEQYIMPISPIKERLYQSTAPGDACFANSKGYRFDTEYDYYRDMNTSWFGLTCKKGGWDCLRHYEILASGAVLLFKEYNNKPPLCSPVDLPTISYSTKSELHDIMYRLIDNGKPTDEYNVLLDNQRRWLYTYGTTKKRAEHMWNIILNDMRDST